MLRGMGVVDHSCSPSIQEASRQKLEVGLVYIANPRSSRTTQQDLEKHGSFTLHIRNQ